MKTIKVADFTQTPGSVQNASRFIYEVLHPFLEDHWKFRKKKFILDLDGTFGYSYIWLKTLVNWIVAKYGDKTIRKKIKFVSNEEPYLVENLLEMVKFLG